MHIGKVSRMLLRQLETFACIVEQGGLTAAAEHLHLSQPAVSRQLKALERELGAELCLRRGHSVQPTAAGEVAYAFAQRLAALKQDLRQQVAELARPEAGSLVLSCVDTVAVYTLPDLLAAFLALHPAVHVHVHTVPTRSAVAEVLQREADLALTTTPVTHPRLACLPLFDDAVALVASPGFLAAYPPPQVVADLQDLPFIAYEAGTHIRALVDAVLEQHGIRPRIALEFDGHEAVREVLLRGLGLAFVPLSTAGADIAAGRLRRLSPQGLPALSRQTSLIMARDGHPGPAALDFIRIAKERSAIFTGP